jgi:hypothetical protein
MDSSQVGILKETHKVSLRGFLKSTNGARLESEIRLEVLGNLTDETLEGEFADEELSGFLVATDFSEGDGSWAVSVGLLDSSGGGGRLAGSLGGKLLSGGFSSSGFTGSLLSTSHFLMLFLFVVFVGVCCEIGRGGARLLL